jgi:hypothetical protein
MVQYQKLPENVVKYLIFFGIIFCLIVIIPNNKLGIKDSIILSIILTLSFAIIEHATLLLSEKSVSTTEKFDPVQFTQEQPTSTTKTTQSTLNVPPISQTSSVQVQNDTSKIDVKSEISQSSEVEIKPEQTIVVTNSEETESNLYNGEPNADKKLADGSREKDDVITSDMPYTDYHHLPLPDDYKSSKFEYGYSFLPPEKWYPTPPFPPVCVSEKRCPVCPAYTIGTPVDVKEWYSAGKILPPDGINVDFIKKLNAGR